MWFAKTTDFGLFFSSFVAELSWQVGSSHQGDWLKGTIRTGWKINPPNLHKTSNKKQTKTANGIYIIPGLQNFALLIYVTFFFSEHQKSINHLPGEFRDFAIRRTLPRFLPSLAQRNWPSLVDWNPSLDIAPHKPKNPGRIHRNLSWKGSWGARKLGPAVVLFFCHLDFAVCALFLRQIVAGFRVLGFTVT